MWMWGSQERAEEVSRETGECVCVDKAKSWGWAGVQGKAQREAAGVNVWKWGNGER